MNDCHSDVSPVNNSDSDSLELLPVRFFAYTVKAAMNKIPGGIVCIDLFSDKNILKH